MDFARLQSDYNFMVISRKGERLRTYKYDTARRFFDAEGGRFYAYAYNGLKKVVLQIDWEK